MKLSVWQTCNKKEKLSEKTNVEIEKNRADLVMDNRLAYLQEEYALSFEKAANDYPAIDDPEAAKREIQDLKGKSMRLDQSI